MKKNIFFVLMFVSIAFISCKKADEYPKLVYKYAEHNFQYGQCDTSSSECVDIKIKTLEISGGLPATVQDSVKKAVNNFMLAPTVGESKYSSFEQLRDSLIDNYKKTRLEIPDMPLSYGLERSIKVETDTLGIFAMEFFEYTFFGGAHPNTVTVYENINLVDGRKIKISDLFNPGFEEKLNVIAEKSFRKVREIKPDENLEEAGYWFENGKFKLNNNFIITKEGLKFLFNPYEVAAYYLGATEFLIEYSQLKEIIKKGSALERFIQ
jgi:hypothetical protein